MSDSATLRTPLHALHVELGARMGPFAGYDMPIQFASGILAEHLHTRSRAGLFDVSHMGQAELVGPDHATVAAALERLCPADFLGLAPGRQRYSQLLNAEGGIVDDLMVSRPPGADGRLNLVVNASRKAVDFALLESSLPPSVRLTRLDRLALVALQGPAAVAVLERLEPNSGLAAMAFMSARPVSLRPILRLRLALRLHRRGRFRDLAAGRRGGSLRAAAARRSRRGADRPRRARFAAARSGPVPLRPRARRDDRSDRGRARLVDPEAATRSKAAFPARRASRRRSPRARRASGSASGRKAARRRAKARKSSTPRAPRSAASPPAASGPRVGAPIAMGYVASSAAAPGTPVSLMVRGKPLAARVSPLPFHPHAYHRG